MQKTLLKPAKQVSEGTDRQSLVEARKDPTKRLLKVQVAFSYYEWAQVCGKAARQHLKLAPYIRRAALMQRILRE